MAFDADQYVHAVHLRSVLIHSFSELPNLFRGGEAWWRTSGSRQGTRVDTNTPCAEHKHSQKQHMGLFTVTTRPTVHAIGLEDET